MKFVVLGGGKYLEKMLSSKRERKIPCLLASWIVDDLLDYYHIDKAVKCKLFSLTLTKLAMAWYKSLSNGSIDSWSDLCEAFTTHFTIGKPQHTTIDMLKVIK